MVQYSYHLSFGSQADMAPAYTQWQNLIADPNLDRRFGTMFISFPLGAIITGTFYGTLAEFEATGIPQRLPQTSDKTLVINDWLGSIAHDAEHESLYLAEISTPFYSKSLGFTRQNLIPTNKIKDLFQWVDRQDKGTLLWFIIFDASGGAVGDVPTNSTAYANRDKVLYYQSYVIGLPLLSKTKNFVTNFHNQVLAAVPPGTKGTYAGYVDPALPDGQQQYWGSNLPLLQSIKKQWDPRDVFRNPQSVRPAA